MADKSDLIKKLLKCQESDSKDIQGDLSDFDPEKLDPKQLEALMSQVISVVFLFFSYLRHDVTFLKLCANKDQSQTEKQSFKSFIPQPGFNKNLTCETITSDFSIFHFTKGFA
jgi:hypothetical protein